MIFIDYSNLILPFENACELCRGSLQYGYVLQLKVSFKMGLFSDTRHTHPGMFYIEVATPWDVITGPGSHFGDELRILENCISNSTK